MLNDIHIAAINRTRKLLREMETATLTEARYPYGRFGEACRAADDSLHQVLLISQHWLTPEILGEEPETSDEAETREEEPV